jgi:deoxyribonuclease-4
MRFGIHCSIRNGYLSALEEAKNACCDTLQMFTHSPRVWKFNLPKKDVIEEFVYLRKQMELYPLIIHTAYLPNPASSDKKIYSYSKSLLEQEFMLAKMFEADYLVMHAGSFSEGKSFDTGIKNLVSAIDYCFSKIISKNGSKNEKVPMLLLENVCGVGRKIGRNFDELKVIIDRSKFGKYIGICIDTAHLHSYGYELDKESGFEEMVTDLKNSCGIEKLKMFHLNDSKVVSGSQIDRHEHIGKGTIGIPGFKRILNYPAFKDLVGIIETPKEVKFGEYSKKDRENILLLKKLAK